MTTNRRSLLAAGTMAALAAPALAQGRAVTVLVGFPAGGVADIICRIVVDQLARASGQAMVVENRGGAGGTIAATAAARAVADGQTLLFVTSGHAGNAALFANLPYDGLRDFAPIGGVAQSPVVVLVNQASRLRDMAQLVAEARARPGRLMYAAAAGGATLPALGAAVFREQLQLDLTAVNYRGTAPALAGLLAQETDFAFDIVAGAIGLVRDGQLRALAVGSAARVEVLPQVPTIAETALPGYDVTGWFGLLAPAGLPAALQQQWQAALQATLAAPAVRQKLLDLGADPMPLDAAAFQALMVRETARWTALIRSMGLSAQ